MGLFSGQMSYVRYQIENTISGNIKTTALERLKEFSFKEIDTASLREKSMGWVSAENMASVFFDDMHYAKGPYLVFALRIDIRRVPPLTMKAAFLREEIKYKEATGKEKLFKKDKDMLREEVWQALIKKALPAPSVYDVCWNTSTGEIIFFSTSKTANDEFVSLFSRSFEAKLNPRVPEVLAGAAIQKKKLDVTIENLSLAFTDE